MCIRDRYSIYGGVLLATIELPLAGFSTATVADLSRKETQERLSRSAVPAFFKLAGAWKLRDETARQFLGGVSNGLFYQLKRGRKKTLDQDKLTRISLLLGIFKALNILYSRKLADAWVNLPNSNPMFEGEAPLTYMIKGGVPALMRVRQLLDARRGGR
ncbi:MAG: antitoxin Xre-like helix-turn-helix domain-containing protein [Terriglobia bacterium]